MFGFLFALFGAWFLYAIARPSVFGANAPKLRVLLIGGYALRLALALFVVREFSFFSHGAGGDSIAYEYFASWIATLWDHTGIHFVTGDEIPGIGAATLPPNLFALIIYANGGRTLLGCTAVVALLACLTVLNIYSLAVELGCDPKITFRIAAVTLFAPAFLLYTSDTYKDGLVLFFVVGAVCSAMRLSRRFSLVHLAFGLICLWALWYVRHYLVFATIGPLAVGLAGFGSKSSVRSLVIALGIAALLIGLSYYTNVLSDFTSRAQETFDTGTGESARAWNAEAGASGVTFDDGGSPYGALGPKILYTLFSPFPWQFGSLGFNIGKLDVALWYFFFYYAVKASIRLWKTDRPIVLMLLVVLVPTTFVYALTMANIGLILRQRMPIVMLGTLLANLYWRKQPGEDPATEDVPTTELTLPAKAS